MRFDRRVTAVAALAVLALSACSATNTSGTPVSPSAAGTSHAPAQEYYLSLGDSYAAGYQPLPTGGAHTTRAGFPYQVVTDAKAKGYDYTLVNLACSGATTTSLLQTPGCDRSLLGPGAPSYDGRTQADVAQRFLTAHRGHVGLVTISIGGNDILRCGTQPNPASCVSTAVQTVGTNLGTLLARIRAEAGPATRIVGTTYPDVLLGGLLSSNALVRTVATQSVLAFRAFLNPQLARFYAAAHARFVDVTAATGGYGSLDRMTTLAPYGRIPVPVARICTLTWVCQLHDIHPRPVGHALIAHLVVATLPRR